MSKSILIFILNGVGGAEKVSIEISKMLINAGWRVSFGVVDYTKIFDEDGGIIPYLPINTKIEYVSFLGPQITLLRRLYKTIVNTSPNVVFASAMHINQRILLLSHFFHKIQFVVRNDNYLYTLPKLKRITLALTYRFADKIIAQTEEMNTELVRAGIDTNRIITLHNPLNCADIQKKAEETFSFKDNAKVHYVAIGRLAYQKGFDILIEAFAKVVLANQDGILYIIGDIEYGNRIVYNQLIEQIERLGISGKVIFTGFEPNPYKYIANANVYVLSSRYEGLPNTLIEAQMLGVPCAATKCIPIISRIITDGQTGFLAENENPNSLAHAMRMAASMNRIKMTYKPSTSQEFIKVFEDAIEK